MTLLQKQRYSFLTVNIIYLYIYILYHCQQLCYYLNNSHTYAGFKIIFKLLAWISLGFCQGSFFSPLSIINTQSAHVLLFFLRNLFLFIKNLYVYGVPIIYLYLFMFPKSFWNISWLLYCLIWNVHHNMTATFTSVWRPIGIIFSVKF